MIKIENLYKSFGHTDVLLGVTLEVRRGESLAIIGGSGSGKSVLLKSILGLMRPDSGQITVNSTPLTPEFMAEFGMLFQGAALFDSMPVWQNVAFRKLRTLTKSAARDLAIEKLAVVGLDASTADQYPAQLSGGMQKRAALARAIAADPKVIFFDEPTTGLDPIRAAKINSLIRRIVTELGVTAITITHDMTSVRSIADRVAMLDGGKIIWQGSPTALDDETNPAVRHFVDGTIAG